MAVEGREGRERDLVLDPMQFAYIKDLTKGNINVLVGPNKTSLSGTDVPVTFMNGRFVECRLEEAVRPFASAAAGEYLVLENPSISQPRPGPANSTPDLGWGKKVNLTGPVMFPLWPGQMATTIVGHNLRSNQYLIVRVYDEQAARENWSKAVVKKSKTADGKDKPEGVDTTAAEVKTEAQEVPADLVMGQHLVIKGIDVSFYIPPTGVEVVADANGHIRDAVTLERLDYCILLDESGNKRYVRGPAVVFPKPTETFLTSPSKNEGGTTRKFRAFELSEISGLYIKVIADYEDESVNCKAGDELFITGKDQPIYFPREEHSLVRYGDQQIHHAIAIPAGEGRYVLDRNTGKISLVKGPAMFLPDPRTQVVVRRILPQKLTSLIYPGNTEALTYNQRLETEVAATTDANAMVKPVKSYRAAMSSMNMVRGMVEPEMLFESSASPKVADEISRGTAYTKPRTITLDTKYEGAVMVNLWTGYAMLIVDRQGNRTIHVGPKTVMLEYDEQPEVLVLSTGKPKNTDALKETVYLRVSNNWVSDIITIETADLVKVSLKLSYRVNFEGQPENWFAVENYVKLLCDHIRSLLRGAIKKVGIEEFNAKSIDIVRDTVLGKSVEKTEKAEKVARPGRVFTENGMRVYDLEVLDVAIGNADIAQLLTQSQHEAVSEALRMKQRERELDIARRDGVVQRDIETEAAKTRELQHSLKLQELDRQTAMSIKQIRDRGMGEDLVLAIKEGQQAVLDTVEKASVDRSNLTVLARIENLRKELGAKDEDRKAETVAIQARAEAIKGGVVEALNNLGDKEFAAKVAKDLAPLAVLTGRSVGDALGDLVRNMPKVGETVKRLLEPAKSSSGE